VERNKQKRAQNVVGINQKSSTSDIVSASHPKALPWNLSEATENEPPFKEVKT
jgi:hypothetical protein